MRLFGPGDPQIQLDLGRLSHRDVEAKSGYDQRTRTRYAELQDVTTGDRLHSPTLRRCQWEAGGS
jgi:hypothetical protein